MYSNVVEQLFYVNADRAFGRIFDSPSEWLIGLTPIYLLGAVIATSNFDIEVFGWKSHLPHSL